MWAGRPADDEREHDRRGAAQAARERELVPAKCADPASTFDAAALTSLLR